MLENEIKINQFSMIGKIFKYEFISIARVFVPVYGALLVISFLAGMFLFSEEFFEGFNGDKALMFFVLFPIFIIFCCATFIITLLGLGRRFRKSLLGNEAYLNLTLPVSLWAHLLARILSAFVWLLIYSLILVISLALFYKNMWQLLLEEYPLPYISQKFVEETGMRLSKAISIYSVAIIITQIFIASFVYMVYAVGHLAKKHRILLQFGVAVLGLCAVNTVQSQLTLGFFIRRVSEINNLETFAPMLVTLCNISNFCDIAFTLIFSGITYLILRFKLNLE